MNRGRQHPLGVGLDPGVLQDLSQRQLCRGLVSEQLGDEVLASKDIDGGKPTLIPREHLEVPVCEMLLKGGFLTSSS